MCSAATTRIASALAPRGVSAPAGGRRRVPVVPRSASGDGSKSWLRGRGERGGRVGAGSAGHWDGRLGDFGGRQRRRCAPRREFLTQRLLLGAQLRQLACILLAQTLDQRIALRVRARLEAELVEPGGELAHVGLHPAQPLGQALDADGTGVGVGQEVRDQAPALVRAGGALVLGGTHQECGEPDHQDGGTAQHQSPAQPRREPFPAILKAHGFPPRSEGRSRRSRSGSRGRTAT